MPTHDTPRPGASRPALDAPGGDEFAGATCRISTTTPSRYLLQFCRHMRSAATRSGAAINVTCTSEHGEVRTPLGDVSLTAYEGKLIVEVVAATEADLASLKTRTARNLERFARRESLRVAWTDQVPATATTTCRTPA